ncbi:MAG: class I SAM-dependent methyltransferase [Myxococcales bacterium]|nr:class I SAM-dependent methyltransferase [Myxococcales bacterium]
METALAENEAIYDRLWQGVPLVPHERWPIWADLKNELHRGPRALELGCGTLPRLPVSGGYFADLSRAALKRLQDHGGHSVRAAGPLPFCDGAFQVVCAFEVLEHIPDDAATISEIARVLRPGGAFFLSVPVDPQLFTGFDAACGHVRRYDAEALSAKLAQVGLHIERWTTQPNHFSALSGALIGGLLRILEWFPRLTLWLKRKSVENQLARSHVWRTTAIADSHRDGGLIAIARRR